MRGQPIQSWLQPPAAATPGTTINSTAPSSTKAQWTPELNRMMNSIGANAAKTDGTWGSQAKAGLSPDDGTTLQQLGATGRGGSDIQSAAAQRALEAMRQPPRAA